MKTFSKTKLKIVLMFMLGILIFSQAGYVGYAQGSKSTDVVLKAMEE